jgi:hypothetical protein
MAAFDRICQAAPSPNVKLGSFGRDAHDAKAWTAKGASFVALASTLLIAQKFREVAAELPFTRTDRAKRLQA